MPGSKRLDVGPYILSRHSLRLIQIPFNARDTVSGIKNSAFIIEAFHRLYGNAPDARDALPLVFITAPLQSRCTGIARHKSTTIFILIAIVLIHIG
jgi:hypothetical protein